MVISVEEKPHKKSQCAREHRNLGTYKELHVDESICADVQKVKAEASHRVDILEASDTVSKQWQNLHSVCNPQSCEVCQVVTNVRTFILTDFILYRK